MQTTPPDTAKAAEDLQVRLVRGASVARRLALACALSETTASLSRAAIARAHPAMDEREADLRFLRLHYGPEIADWVRSCLKESPA